MRKIIAAAALLPLIASLAAAQAAPAPKTKAKAAEKKQEAKAAPAAAKDAAPAASQPKDRTAEAIAGLRTWDEKLSSLKASFTQQVAFKEAGLKQNVEGSLSYIRPNLLRIDHSKPAPQTIVTDKADIWIYKPADKQAVKTSWDAWRGTQDQNFSGILDFGNYASLTEKNNVAVTGGENGAPLVMTLTPKSGAPYALKLTLGADFFPLEAELTVDSTVISTKLSGVERNAEISRDLFKFSPPSGTEILKLNK